MSKFQYKSYGNTLNPQKLVVFIHGYKSSMNDLAADMGLLSSLLPDCVIVTPQSDKYHKNSNVLEWYDVSAYDVDRKRRNPQTSVEEIVEIYNKAGEQLSIRADEINEFIDEVQDLYGLNDERTYIAGFSQGAMVALFVAMSREGRVGGCFALSGVVAGKDCLEHKIKSKPVVYMLHGKSDITVQYKTLSYSVEWLKKHGIDVQVCEYENLAHKIIIDEIDFMSKIIKK